MRTGDDCPMFRKVTALCAILIIILSGCMPESREASGSTAGQGKIPAVIKSEQEMVNGIAIDKSSAVVKETVADVFAEPDVRSQRITQVIYNQAIKILTIEGSWARIAAHDGSAGWIRTKFIDSDISSISGRSYTHRIVIIGREKSIFSGPTGGITIKDAVMGSVFYAFNSSDNAYEVYLPGNITGWIRGSGIIHIGLEADIPITSGADFAASALKHKGTSYLVNGLSSMGIDSSGMIYISARVNGINPPRDLKKLAEFGEEVQLDSIETGDIVFLGDEKDNIQDAGIYLGNGQYIHSSKTQGYVRLDGLNDSGSDGKPVFARRIFR